MAMKLNEVVPFGRSLDEYVHMFSLTKSDLSKRILGTADGPASFNAELSARDGSVISMDPIYGLSSADIEKRFNQVLPDIISQVKATPDDWVWKYHPSPDILRERRIEVTKRFCKDYSNAINSERYVKGNLPHIPYPDDSFELALCSHFLLLYADRLSLEFHLESITEILRVSPELRIFPIIQLDRKKAPFLDDLITILLEKNLDVSIEKVKYELQKGGNEMLRIRRKR